MVEVVIKIDCSTKFLDAKIKIFFDMCVLSFIRLPAILNKNNWLKVILSSTIFSGGDLLIICILK